MAIRAQCCKVLVWVLMLSTVLSPDLFRRWLVPNLVVGYEKLFPSSTERLYSNTVELLWAEGTVLFWTLHGLRYYLLMVPLKYCPGTLTFRGWPNQVGTLMGVTLRSLPSLAELLMPPQGKSSPPTFLKSSTLVFHGSFTCWMCPRVVLKAWQASKAKQTAWL